MRIAIAEFGQETDTFSPLVCDLGDFEAYGLYYGAEVLERVRGVGPLGGFLDVLDEQPARASVDVRPILRAWGNAGGRITAATVEHFVARLRDGVRQALPLDAVFLSLHGAAAAEDRDDIEGHVLRAVREVVGADVPIVTALDHHANITAEMFAAADLLVGHETQPHDPRSTGRKAARLLFRWLADRSRKPCRAWRKIPLITPQDQFLTSSGPMQEWFALARELEQLPDVLDVSPYPMQPWLDVAEGGWAVVVHTRADAALAERLATQMARKAWELRDRFWESQRVSPAEAIRTARAAERGLIIVSDTGDSVYGGAPGDNTVLLRELLAQPGAGLALVPVVDPEALQAVLAAGVGADVTLAVGGKKDREFCRPVNLTARVIATSQGVRVELPERGIVDLQKTALLASGSVRLVLLDHRSFAINHPVLYQHLGVDIADAQLVVVKTASNFQFFQRWRQGLVRADTPGTTQSDLTGFTWKRLPRPTYPFDRAFDYTGERTP